MRYSHSLKAYLLFHYLEVADICIFEWLCVWMCVQILSPKLAFPELFLWVSWCHSMWIGCYEEKDPKVRGIEKGSDVRRAQELGLSGRCWKHRGRGCLGRSRTTEEMRLLKMLRKVESRENSFSSTPALPFPCAAIWGDKLEKMRCVLKVCKVKNIISQSTFLKMLYWKMVLEKKTKSDQVWKCC